MTHNLPATHDWLPSTHVMQSVEQRHGPLHQAAVACQEAHQSKAYASIVLTRMSAGDGKVLAHDHLGPVRPKSKQSGSLQMSHAASSERFRF